MGKTPENVAKVGDLIPQDRRLTIQDLCNTLGLSYGTCQRILSEELNMRRIAVKFVPRLLQNEQKQHRLEVCRELQEQLQEDPNFLSKVVTGRDEENIRMEILELDDHPYFVATQYHPEYLSRPLKPSPPFFGLILASVGKLHSYLARGCRLTPRQLSDVESGNHKKVDI
ncbi:hypothetical protein B7P43_G15642 [Cryptotermes secundus]|uniref:CTP synthase (glutamine hydrolyzing) n=1 Tax=Cryptotermes secundus TaxID=105785 RepID=A0A2J7PDV1_9NEOP|nr:hypothetical protein B7P43_G15642 [Cryptotermes secundus]